MTNLSSAFWKGLEFFSQIFLIYQLVEPMDAELIDAEPVHMEG